MPIRFAPKAKMRSQACETDPGCGRRRVVRSHSGINALSRQGRLLKGLAAISAPNRRLGRQPDRRGSFFTGVTQQRRPVFAGADAAEILRMAFRKVRTTHPFHVDALWWFARPPALHLDAAAGRL